MEYNVNVNCDIFEHAHKPGIYTAQCISSDAVMSKGTAPLFLKHFPKLETLKSPSVHLKTGRVYLVDTVFNLVTRDRHYNTPTMVNLTKCLIYLAAHCAEIGVKELYFHKLDRRLEASVWKSIFKDADINLTLCVPESRNSD